MTKTPDLLQALALVRATNTGNRDAVTALLPDTVAEQDQMITALCSIVTQLAKQLGACDDATADEVLAEFQAAGIRWLSR